MTIVIPVDNQTMDVRLDSNHQPIAILWDGSELRIREISNTYRVTSGSFENPIWREYFNIVTEDGWWILIYYDLLDPHWKWEIAYD